ncbi:MULTISPECIES: XdhC family protein [unclassified Bacillus (in: firmicutes)]|uniref:XdhC family protein n=1 Tax=unclassified Bacillus (in: firmicutes) TaxID=185979 RepID=UPI0020D275D0|nr:MULTISPECIES: XdhC/CoxI family protein [unclassified Bacillus (in: firmicutes)]
MEDFYQILDVLDYPEEKVIATIIGVEGSAYKKEGSSMLFFSDGTQKGMLTAGCLEEDLALKVREVFKKQEAIILQYDMYMEDDLDWGQGAGCNGTIDILIEPVTEQLTEDLHMVKELLSKHKPVIALKKLDDLGEYVFIEEDGEPFGNWSGPLPTIEFTSKSGSITRDGSAVFQQTFYPKPRLIIFGAGPDARPLVSLAAETGFSVVVCDWRETFCQKEHFPSAAKILQGFPIDLLQQISFSPYDFVVIMTHQFKRDQELLTRILNKNIRYLGVLGPRERTRRLLNSEDIPRGIFSPMGVAIGAKGPVEIAVSVMAQMIEVWRKPLHERIELLWTIPD